jgi:hypothetical protein
MRPVVAALFVCLAACSAAGGSTDATGTRAIREAEAMAIDPATGTTHLTQPSTARLMTYRDALAAMGGDVSTAVAPTHKVWFVHVFGRPSSAAISYPPGMKPPPLGRDYSVIVDTGSRGILDYNV